MTLKSGLTWKLKTGLIFASLLFAAFSINACCSCKTQADENMIEGIITVIGNEPFTKLALNVDDNKYYVLDCSDELRSEFMKSQGKLYRIQYSEIYEKEELPYIKVESAVVLKERSKK